MVLLERAATLELIKSNNDEFETYCDDNNEDIENMEDNYFVFNKLRHSGNQWRRFATAKLISYNVFKKANPDEEFHCARCGKEYYNKRDFDMHVIQHLFKCFTCEQYFNDKKTLVEHLNDKHLLLSSFNCLNCDKFFKDKKSVDEHSALEHGDIKEENIGIKKQIIWNKNLETLTEIPITKFALKNKSYQKLLDLKFHAENVLCTRSQGKKMKIDDLRKEIETRTHKAVQERLLRAMISVYPGHYNLDIDEESIVIEIKTSDYLMTPKTIATRRSEFQNEMLDALAKKDKYIDLISYPELNIPEQKPVKDIPEQNVFKIVNIEDNSNKDGQAAYKCVQCDKIYQGKKKLKSHYRIRHTFKKRFACKFCEKSYNKKKHLRAHILLKRVFGKPFKCSICGKGYKGKKKLENHQLKHEIKPNIKKLLPFSYEGSSLNTLFDDIRFAILQ